MSNSDQSTQAIQDLLNGKTLNYLIQILESTPINDDFDRKAKLSEYLIEVCELIDQGVIKIDSNIANTGIHNLLASALLNCFGENVLSEEYTIQ